MSGTFASDFRWQATYDGVVTETLASALSISLSDVRVTSPESDDDRRYNTDILVWYEGRPQRVSRRLRRYVVGDEFTLRYGRPAAPTEWQKLWAGFGDLYFYGRGREDGRVDRWFLGRLAVFKEWVRDHLARGVDPPHILKTNRDGSSEFVSFSRSELPIGFTLASDDDEQELTQAWWDIVRDSRGLEKTGHASVVRWARAGLGLDDR